MSALRGGENGDVVKPHPLCREQGPRKWTWWKTLRKIEEHIRTTTHFCSLSSCFFPDRQRLILQTRFFFFGGGAKMLKLTWSNRTHNEPHISNFPLSCTYREPKMAVIFRNFLRTPPPPSSFVIDHHLVGNLLGVLTVQLIYISHLVTPTRLQRRQSWRKKKQLNSERAPLKRLPCV